MHFPPRAISTLMVVQCFFIWLGHALVRKMIRHMEQADLPQAFTSHWPASMRMVHQLGLWAFLIPLLWTSWVTLRSEAPSGIPVARSRDTWITLGLTVVIACLWTWAAMQALNLAFTIHGPIMPMGGS